MGGKKTYPTGDATTSSNLYTTVAEPSDDKGVDEAEKEF